MQRIGTLLVLVAMLSLVAASAHADSDVVQIRLSGTSGLTQYIVPPGKVLLLESIDFCDYWVSQPEPLEVFIQHSTNPSGTVWSSTLSFYSAHNALPRVLRVPAGTAIAMPYYNNLLYKTFLYGVLVDASSQIITAP
jgi:hypothetical protein